MNRQSQSLEPGQITASLFSKNVDDDTKSRIASRILALKPSSIAIVTPALNRGRPSLPEISSKNELQDFVTERSILFLERFCPNYAKWLTQNAPWDHIPEFHQDKELVALWAVDWARWLLGYMGENFYLFDMAETM